jgi:hypoxanthine phosphoribosyltransferase
MKGSVLFLADLVRAWPGAMDLEFVTARLYEGSEPRRLQLALPPGLREVVAGRPVLVVDDIFDTGRTLTAVCEAVERLGPADLRTLVFLKKKRRRRPKALLRRLDWVGFEVPDRFVVGYGLDYGGRFRNLPYVAVFAEA